MKSKTKNLCESISSNISEMEIVKNEKQITQDELLALIQNLKKGFSVEATDPIWKELVAEDLRKLFDLRDNKTDSAVVSGTRYTLKEEEEFKEPVSSREEKLRKISKYYEDAGLSVYDIVTSFSKYISEDDLDECLEDIEEYLQEN